MSEQQTEFDRHMEDPEFRRLFTQERTIAEIAGMISHEMKRQRITQSELARRMGKTKGHVSQLLAGGRNLTLRSLSDMLLAIGKSLEPLIRPAAERRGRWIRVPDTNDWTQFSKVQMDESRQDEAALSIRIQQRFTRGAA